MKTLVDQLRARPHLLLSVGAGVIAASLAPSGQPWIARALIGWNTLVWLYLVQAFWVMSRADHHHLRRTAIAQAEGAGAVLVTATAAVIASMLAIALELAAAKAQPGAPQALPHVLFAVATVAGSWLLMPTLFALSYASQFYRAEAGEGLLFPAAPTAGAEPGHSPRYWDFLYFSFTIAVASQTADVAINTTAMRRLVLMQAVLSFLFNTAILALAVNIGAGLV